MFDKMSQDKYSQSSNSESIGRSERQWYFQTRASVIELKYGAWRATSYEENNAVLVYEIHRQGSKENKAENDLVYFLSCGSIYQSTKCRKWIPAKSAYLNSKSCLLSTTVQSLAVYSFSIKSTPVSITCTQQWTQKLILLFTITTEKMPIPVRTSQYQHSTGWQLYLNSVLRVI